MHKLQSKDNLSMSTYKQKEIDSDDYKEICESVEDNKRVEDALKTIDWKEFVQKVNNNQTNVFYACACNKYL